MVEPDIDLQDLTDLVEGRLGAEHRDALLRRIAASSKHVELLAEVIRGLEGWDPDHAAKWEQEEKRIRGGGPSWWEAVVAWGRTHRMWLVPSGAAAVVALLALPWIVDGDSGDALFVRSGELVAMVPVTALSAGSGWDESPWSPARGNTLMSADTILAMRLGVRLVDLAVARQVDDSFALRRIRAERDSMVAALPASQPVQVLFANAETQYATGGTGATFEATAESLLMDRADPYHLLRGKWLRAAYFAAANGDATFFSSPVTRRVLDAMARRQNVEWAGVAELARGTLDSASLALLATRTRELLAQSR